MAHSEKPIKSAVFLDRDGVLTIPEFRNGRSYAPRRLEDFHIYPDAADAVRRLKQEGFLVIVATNQPDVGAGLVGADVLEQMHDRLRSLVAVDDIEICCDTQENASSRRKPGPGMLLDAAQKWGVDLSQSYMVGDRESDVAAGNSAGCVSVFVDRKYHAEIRPAAQAVTVNSVGEAADWIIARNRDRFRVA